ncbi:MAG: NAD(P)H-dependent glycerol-3-phosphate dehydrogenase [Aquificae bacterium]|nr:NAD(P)H-dependent glycerol-3-phosphate dehydrogenase [Aquificota bacterium]
MRFFILGAGRWGVALATHFSRLGHEVVLYDINEEVVEKLNRGIHPYIEGIVLKNVRATTDLEELSEFNDIVCALPAQVVGDIVKRVDLRGKRFISASKGIDHKNLKRISQIVKEAQEGVSFFVLSGPSFAKEVSLGLPTALVLGYEDRGEAQELREALESENFRVYLNSDVAGVELGGALKNVIAIAVGLSDGLGYGHNARSALITRGIHEMARIGEALGARRETFFGLSGAGDLILTSTSDLSRNRRFGFLLGKGYSVEEALSEISQTVEGIKTAQAVFKILEEKDIDAPICRGVYEVVSGKDPKSVYPRFFESNPGEEFPP